MTTRRPARSRQDGRFTFDGGHDRLCRCGRTFGKHMAAAPHDFDGAEDGGPDCARFRPAKSVTEGK